ncbi:MAG: glycosyltransferase family 4 protein [Planctomycetaceae bacterium]
MQVCFVALNALPAIDPTIPGPIGGIETRSWTLARSIAQSPDVELRFAIRHHGRVRTTHYSGVTIVPMIDRLLSLRHAVATRVDVVPTFPFLKLKQWSWNLLWQMPLLAICRPFKPRPPATPQPLPALRNLPTDLFCTFGVQSTSAQVVATGRAIGKPVVLMLGSDGDLHPLFQQETDERDQYGTSGRIGRYTLLNADLIVVQSATQQKRLRDEFSRDSLLIENPIDVPRWQAGLQQPVDPHMTRGLDRYVLWVGRSDTGPKRPEECLEIARRCPNVHFLMVLNPYDPIVERHIHQTAPPNVRIIERVPFEEMPKLFKQAAIFLNTSSFEGFPNTFLQSAITGIPVGSLVVMGDYLREIDLGFCADGDLDALAQFVQQSWDTPREAERVDAVRQRVIERHALARQSQKLIEAFRTLLDTYGSRDGET